MKHVCFTFAFTMLAFAAIGAGGDDDTKLKPAGPAGSGWKLGAPIVTYWAGPGFVSTPMKDADAAQLKEGGWNLAWCREKELDVVGKHGLRAQLNDPLLTPASLDDPAKLKALDALIDRVRKHPALYCYFLGDEPGAKNFAGMGRLVSHLREKDPAHLAYINLFPTYASNEQLGAAGETVTAYKDYLRQFVETVRPSLLSYDHYQFGIKGDGNDYFLNLGLMRDKALDAGLPFLNIVQACTWTLAMREPVESEMRYLIYTTLAYGAQGISYYVYSHPGHSPGIATAEGKPTAVYEWLKPLNRDFAAIAQQLQPLRSLGIYHAGMMPPGSKPLPKEAAFRFDPAVPSVDFQAGKRVQGVLLGTFGPTARDAATHAVVVNLDYQAERLVRLEGSAALDRFDPATGRWSRTPDSRLELRLPSGGGVLVRVRP